MDFEWDDEKDATTREERGFGFADAAGIFLGRRIEWQDTRKNYGEVRMNTVGEFGGDFYFITYTMRTDDDGQQMCRIISARLANKKERSKWHASA